MTSRRRLAGLAVFLAIAGSPAAAAGQGIAFDANRLLADPDWSVYRLGYTHRLVGPVGTELFGTLLRQRDGTARDLYGLGIALTLFQGGEPGFYAFGGVESGTDTGPCCPVWTGWWAGLGFEVVPLQFLSLAAEARYHRISPQDVNGLEVGGRFRLFWSTGDPPPQPPYTEVRPAAPVPGEPEVRNVLRDAGAPADVAERLAGVVAAATRAMGTPYVWGGTGGADGGFDCSGLIQYAYGTQGMSIPRVSRDQAKAGRKVDKKLSALRPGDILTFSTRGGPVTHVGMYVGDGQFIHSASQGVQMSALSAADVYGKWWYKRWVGVRRILE